MKNLLIMCVIALLCNSLFSQTGTPTCKPTLDDYKRFLKSKTMVVYENVLMSEYNVKIKEIMDRTWKITPYEFIPYGDMKKLQNNNELSFLFVSQVVFEKDPIKARYNFLSLVMGQSDVKDKNLPDLCSLPLSYADERIESDSYIYKLEAFVNFMQIHIKNVLDNPKLIGENALKKYNKTSKNLSGKTLYLLKDECAAEINTGDKVKAIYKFPFKFVEREDISDAIARKDENVVFLHKVGPEKTKNKARVYKLIVGAGDSKLYYFDWTMVKNDSKRDALQASDLKNLNKMK